MTMSEKWLFRMKRFRLVLVAPVLLLALASAMAAEAVRFDHDEARAAVERHDIRPLDEILAHLRDKIPGEIVRVTLERECGAWLYELRVVDAQGRVREVAVDATTGTVKNIGED
jgi:uncharacterized membrane protein YkoI